MASSDSIFNTSSANQENPEDKVSKQVETSSKGATHVVYEILYDRSGSMIQMPTAPEAIQNFITQQKEFCETNNITSRFTLTVFDTIAEKVPKFDDVDLRETGLISPDWLRPRGYTRLVDTAVERIAELRKKVDLVETPEPMSTPEPTSTSEPTSDDLPVWQGIFVILTDGQDNQSHHSSSRLKREIVNLTEQGIQCYFLGANQDAIRTGNNYGFTEDQSLTYNGVAAMEAMRSASDNITQGLYETPPNSRATVQVGFSQLQREVSGGTQDTVPAYDSSDHYKTKPLLSPMRHGGGLSYQATGADIGLQMPSMTRTETVGGNSGSTVDSPVTVPETQSGMVTPPPLPIPSSPPALFRKAVRDT